MALYKIIGLMSGTSMDGLDIAYCAFDFKGTELSSFQLLAAKFYPYSAEFQQELREADSLSVPNYLQLDKKIGTYYAQLVNEFIREYQIDKAEITLIASHGQTIFHQPQNGFTSQIGCGTTLAVLTDIQVVNDFRTKDVVLGGQGAPLVPIGDFGIFKKEAASFLNIGGFANISFEKEGVIQAYDISPANLPINQVMRVLNQEYDRDGATAAQGKVNGSLLQYLNQLAYYQQPFPKSLGTEWLNAHFYPVYHQAVQNADLVATLTEHIAIQIAHQLTLNQLESVFVTGGGAKNSFLIQRIQAFYSGKVIVPEVQIIDFKEAIIFAYLGVLYWLNLPNNVTSVTGASRPVVGGVLHKSI